MFEIEFSVSAWEIMMKVPFSVLDKRTYKKTKKIAFSVNGFQSGVYAVV